MMNEIILEINRATNNLLEVLPKCIIRVNGTMINNVIFALIQDGNNYYREMCDITYSSMEEFVRKTFSSDYDMSDEEDAAAYTKIYARALEIDRLIKFYHITN